MSHFGLVYIQFSIVLGVLLILGLIQIIITVVSLNDCDNTDNPLTFICDMDREEQIKEFWVPSISILVGVVCWIMISYLSINLFIYLSFYLNLS